MVHTDHLGRPIRMTDATKATVWQAAYKPWGDVQTLSGSTSLNLRWPGQYFQIENGYAYNWHRHYDPTTGRYTQPDPLRFIDGPSMYAYVGSSPWMVTDRNGLCIEDLCIAEGAVAATWCVSGGCAAIGGAIVGGLTTLGLFTLPGDSSKSQAEQKANSVLPICLRDRLESCKVGCDATLNARTRGCWPIANERTRSLCLQLAHEDYAECLVDCHRRFD